MMRYMIDRLAGRTRLTVEETQRALILRDGRFEAILGPGEHRLKARGLKVERHDLSNPVFASKLSDALERTRPDLFAEHFTVFEGTEGEATIVTRKGQLVEALRRSWDRKVLWTDAGPWTVERFAYGDDLALPQALRRQAEAGALGQTVFKASVEDGRTGLLFIDGDLKNRLGPGVHWFWNVGRKVEVSVIDLRRREMDVTGQEILTADRLTLRVNLTAGYRVVDPVKAATKVKDFAEALRLSVQLAFRKALGAKTLDRLLADKSLVDDEALARVKAEMAAIGIEVAQTSLKDVVLPGEVREILNQVVAAEKAAEANVIRRREETNATRSLLNTAKVMAENPVMLRLKELEALGEIAGKVERLTIHNGAEGLMNDIVRLRD